MLSALRTRLVAAFLEEMRTSDPETIRRHYAEAATNVALRVLSEHNQRREGDAPANAFLLFGADSLIFDLAACRTFEELRDCETGGEPLKPSALDELILRARDLVDTLGLKPERPAHPVALPW